MRGVLIIYGIICTAIIIWYFTSINDALHDVYLQPLQLAAFLITFKLALISFSIIYVKDNIKSTL